MRQFEKILMALTLALAIAATAGAAHAGTQTPISKCQDFACQS